MLMPLDPIFLPILKAVTALSGIIPVMVEFILFLRILAVYPYNTTSRIKFFTIIFFPVAMKIARLTNISFYLVKLSIIDDESLQSTGMVVLQTLPNPEIEWFLNFFDNL